jgi:hypothetical protein
MAAKSPYSIASEAFFSDWRTKKAVVDVAGSTSLTIYCGAGTTIDRTTLSWGDMVYRLLLREAAAPARPRITPAEALRLRSQLSPLELASVYEQYVYDSQIKTKMANTAEAHVPRLQDMLYRNAGWESGVLVRNIVRLAVGLSLLGRDIKVVTTNYDTYIEQEFADYLGELNTSGIVDIPGYTVSCVRQQNQIDGVPPTGSGSAIELIYLHGRVPPSGSLEGALALSESDYQDLRNDVSAMLHQAFDGREILVLGSSLTDPPLLGELSAQRRSSASRTRVAVVPATSTGMSDVESGDYPQMVRHLRARALQFGLGLLVPDFHFQIAQFCQEVVTCAQMGPGFREYGNRKIAACDERYGARLTGWWDKWTAKAVGPQLVTDKRNACLDKLEASDHWGTDAGEVYKLELWVRHRPASERRLGLWGASTGVLSNREALKYENLGLMTRNASVRAFVEGKPVWLAKEDLASIDLRPEKKRWIEALDGRWLRYLAVPIRLSESGATNLPVGVVTLAAMGDGTKTNVPVDNADAMVQVVKFLEEVGGDLLGVP